MSSSTVNKSKKFAMGWLIVVGCMLIQAIPFSVANNIQPQFMDYVVAAEGFKISGFSLIFTISTIVGAIVSPVVGKMYSKYNPKILLITGAILSGGGFLSFAFAGSLIQFYIIGGITQIGTAMLSSIGVPLLISHWFSEEVKGKAMGLAFAGGAFGNMFLQQLTAISLLNNGYKKSYLMFGVLSLIVGLLVTIFIIKMPKSDNDIVKSKNEKSRTNEKKVDLAYSITELKNIKYFWFLAIALMCIGFYISAIMVQYPTYLKTEVMLAPTLVGSAGSVMAIFSLIGNLVGGTLFDKLGIVKCVALAGTSAVIGCLFLIFSTINPIFAFIFAAFFGISIFSYIMGAAYMTGILFGNKNFGSILGIINLMFAVGYAIGASLFGVIVTKLGFRVTWIIVLILIVSAYILMVMAAKGMKKVNIKRLEEMTIKQNSEVAITEF